MTTGAEILGDAYTRSCDTLRRVLAGVWPLHRVIATLVNEQVHHGAEISLMRDLYRNRGSLTATAPAPERADRQC